MTKFLLRDAQQNLYIFEYGRGSWTRTNECQDQNLVPYQLGDTPVTVRTIPILGDFVNVKCLEQRRFYDKIFTT